MTTFKDLSKKEFSIIRVTTNILREEELDLESIDAELSVDGFNRLTEKSSDFDYRNSKEQYEVLTGGEILNVFDTKEELIDALKEITREGL